ncbi:GNAT family N-acetyltransferase, partial [Rickettsiales bacterium]|nr:GNAT family N-acetyltransferase [Rickettsiales bacterium]
MTTLQGSNFKLRPFSQLDAIPLVSLMNTKSIAKYTTIDLPWKIETSKWWISFITDAALRKPLPEIHFVIDIDGYIAGALGIINIDGHKSEIGYWMADEYMSKGIMTEAVGIVTEYGLNNLKLKRIFAPVLTF